MGENVLKSIGKTITLSKHSPERRELLQKITRSLKNFYAAKAWTADKGSRFQPWTGSTALCSWARHFIFIVHLITQVYKLVLMNLMLEVSLHWTNILFRGEGIEILLVTCYRNQDNLWPDEPLGLSANLTLHPAGISSFCEKTYFTKNNSGEEKGRRAGSPRPILYICHWLLLFSFCFWWRVVFFLYVESLHADYDPAWLLCYWSLGKVLQECIWI